MNVVCSRLMSVTHEHVHTQIAPTKFNFSTVDDKLGGILLVVDLRGFAEKSKELLSINQ